MESQDQKEQKCPKVVLLGDSVLDNFYWLEDKT